MGSGTEQSTVRSSDLLLALDFDGTVAPIVEQPSAASIDPALCDLLAEAAAAPRVTVAIISGRDVEELHLKTAGLPVFRVGSHGADCSTPEGTWLWRSEATPLSLDAPIEQRLRDAGCTIERKKLSLAVHYRALQSAPDDALACFESWAEAHGLELVRGRCVVEGRMRVNDKLLALRRLARHTRAARVFYAGDDLTDFAALSWAAQHGTGVFVQSDEREAPNDRRVTVASGIEDLIRLIRAELLWTAAGTAAFGSV